MEQTISFKIDVPEGKKAILKDNKIVFEEIKPQLPKTWEEFCELYPKQEGEAYINNEGNIQVIGIGSPRCEILDINILPNEKAAKQYLALIQLHQLRDCYRQGWKPDCFDNNYFYFIYRCYNLSKQEYEYMIGTELHLNFFLAFQTEELADEFLNNFHDLIEEAGDLI